MLTSVDVTVVAVSFKRFSITPDASKTAFCFVKEFCLSGGFEISDTKERFAAEGKSSSKPAKRWASLGCLDAVF